MDTLQVVQKLFRLGALIRDSPLSPGDVFGTEEPHPVVQSPAVELTPQDTCFPPSWESPAKSAHSTSEKRVSQAPIPTPKSVLQKLSGHSSRPNRMLISGSKGDGRAKRDDVSPRQREGTVSVATGAAWVNYTGPKTIWTEHDSFLPRANPPPSLERKHARNCTEDSVSAPVPKVSSRRLSTLHSSKPSSTRSHSPRRSADVPTFTMSSVASHEPVPDIPGILKRTTSRTTLATETSNDSQATFAPSNCSWKPPASWAGPPETSPTDEVDRSRLLGWFTRKKGADGSKGSSMRVPTRLTRARSLKVLKSIPLDNAGELMEGGAPAVRGAPVASGVVVKIQCSQRDRWHEKPMADIIPTLRSLASK